MRFSRRINPEWARWCGRLLLFVFTVFAAVGEPVVVFLGNGDRVTGEITSENKTRIILKSPVAGRLTIPRDQIIRMVSPAALAAESAKTNAPVAAATPAATPGPDSAPPPAAAPAPVAVPAPAALPMATAQAAPPVSTNAPARNDPWLPGWLTGAWTNWHGNVQFGANVGWGTTDRYALFANASASKKWGRTTSLVNYSLNYGAVNDVMNANRMRGDTKVDVELSGNRRLYSYGLGGAGYDDIRQIEMEYLFGAGMGYRFLDRPGLVLSGELGSQYQSFSFSNASERETMAARIGENLTTKFGNNVTLTQRLGFTPGFEDFSDYQIRFGLTLSMPLFKPLTLNLNIIDEFDSKPAPGVSRNDLQVSTTIGLNF